MAKLLVEDIEGNTHEIKINKVSTKNLKKDDVLFINCEVGDNENTNEINQYLTDVRDMFKSYFPNNKIMVKALVNGKEDIKLTIMKNKEK